MSEAAWVDAEGAPLPETLDLRSSGFKWFAIILLSIGFVSIAVFLAREDRQAARWLAGFFFGVCALIALPQMIGGGSRLGLDCDGFTCRTLCSSFALRWADCREFAPARVRAAKMVTFSTASNEAMHPRLAALARGLTGVGGALPNTYGVSAAQLADPLNRFRVGAHGLKEHP